MVPALIVVPDESRVHAQQEPVGSRRSCFNNLSGHERMGERPEHPAAPRITPCCPLSVVPQMNRGR